MTKPNIIMEELDKIKKSIDKNNKITKYNISKKNNKININYNSIQSHLNYISLFLFKEIQKHNKAVFIYKVNINKYIKNLNKLKSSIRKLPSVYSDVNIIIKKNINKKDKYKYIKIGDLKEHLFLIIKLTGNPDNYNIELVVEGFIKSVSGLAETPDDVKKQYKSNAESISVLKERFPEQKERLDKLATQLVENLKAKETSEEVK